jgi:hydrogenase large subunit
MPTIKIIDPVTRIEGHMKVELTIDSVGGETQIVDARSSGTLFRGFETLLEGRDPWDAPVITQRICGVCPISHAQASVLALENVSDWLPPTNARLLRNLTLGANFIQSHILHFYLLAALDYVPGPAAPPWTPAWTVDLRDGLSHVAENLVGSLEARRHAHEMGAVFGGRMPASHAFIPGGFTATATTERIDLFQGYLDSLVDFIQNTYIPDVEAVGQVYSDYFNIGAGCKNFMAYGVFEIDDIGQDKLFAPGYIENGATQALDDFNSQNITESVTHSWYDDTSNNLTPMAGETLPVYPKGEAYSWLKAPRLFGKPFEVGPLARMWLNGDYQGGISVMDRHVARAYETLKIAEAMQGWLNELDGGPVYDENFEQYSGSGIGLTEAPRGALGHWVRITAGQIERYQVITPTCWNASPKDGQAIPGPVEQALIGTPVQDPDRPIEALRVIHSFDPCVSCAVHVINAKRKKSLRV